MDIPANEKASVWKLLQLKQGSKNVQAKRIDSLNRRTKPLKVQSQHENDKDNRRTSFNASRYRMNLWKNPVNRMRLADHLVFPLNSRKIEQYGSEEAKLRKAINNIEQNKATDGSSSSTVTKDLYQCIFKNKQNRNESEQALTMQKQQDLALTLANKANLAQQDRLRKEYIVAKMVRQKKIKSKNFHRHMKKRQMKEYEKETERLRTTDPVAFSERLKEAEKLRVMERMSLKHKAGSKFARMQKLRARYDKEARDAVSAMHDRGKELLAKQNLQDCDESDLEMTSDDEDTDSSNATSDEDELSDSSSNDEPAKRMDDRSALKSVQWWHKVQEPAKPTPATGQILSKLVVEKTLGESTNVQEDEDTGPLVVGANFADKLAELCTGDNDEVMELEFQGEKEAVAEEEAPKDIDRFLPGWNAWTGPGTEEADEKKRERMLVKAPKRLRQDSKRKTVIIRERVNETLKKHLVKNIPYPYNTPEQFEATLAQPVGREWNTELGHKELIKPRVVVKKGRVIKPMDESAAFLREKDVERLAKSIEKKSTNTL